MIALANQGNEEIYEAPDHVLSIPQAPEMLLPILEVMPCSFSATTSPYAARGPTEEFGQVGDSRVIDKPERDNAPVNFNEQTSAYYNPS